MHEYNSLSILVLFTLLILPGCRIASSPPTPPAKSVLPTASQQIIPTRMLPFDNNPRPTPSPISRRIAFATNPPTSALTPIPTHETTSSLKLTGPYLGQSPPGMEAEIFAPGIISDPAFSEYSGTFSPDGSEYYFYRFSNNSQSMLLFSRLENGTWTKPEPLTFSAGYPAYEPYIGFDNHYLFFAWNHPYHTGQSDLPAYYFVERTSDGWSEPEYAGQGMFLSSSRDGQFYTTDMSSRNTDRKTYLAKITLEQGVFTRYERLPIQANWGNPAHPCIAPDGNYILFDVQSGNYLFVSFKKADGSWGEAIDLSKHGFDPKAGGASVSPDGKYLFFALSGDIWWVDIKVIENLRPLG
jgi:hypothetical protein